MEEKQVISTNKAPAAIGPYSQEIKIGDLIFTSGQIPIVPESGTVLTGDIRLQTEQVLRNLEAVLVSVGSSLDNVIKTTVFITDMAQFNAVNEVYAQFFKNNCPARSCVQVAALPKGVGIEIEAVASAK